MPHYTTTTSISWHTFKDASTPAEARTTAAQTCPIPDLPAPLVAIQAARWCKYLGVYIDMRLRFHYHLREMEKKAKGRLQALQALTGSTWGISIDEMRTVYPSTILPLFSTAPRYGTSYTSSGGFGYQRKHSKLYETFKTTAGSALDIELYLEPINIALDHYLKSTLLCIMPTKPLRK